MKTQITFLYRREKGWNEEFYTTATRQRNTNGKSQRRVHTVHSAGEFSVSPIKNIQAFRETTGGFRWFFV